MPMNIHLQYFSLFRDARGCADETLRTSAGTPADLFRELDLEKVYPLDPRRLRVAVNDEFASWETSLSEGDRVVFIAPVAGG
jgi:molybdopterin converting factor small subunit